MTLKEAAHVLGINPRTLRIAVERGEIEADGPRVFQRRGLETPAAATLIARVAENLVFRPGDFAEDRADIRR